MAFPLKILRPASLTMPSKCLRWPPVGPTEKYPANPVARPHALRMRAWCREILKAFSDFFQLKGHLAQVFPVDHDFQYMLARIINPRGNHLK